MRRTIKALAAQLRSSQTQKTLNLLGLIDAVNGNIEWREPLIIDSGDSHRYGWSRLTSAHGGLIFHRFHSANLNSKFGDSIEVDYLEDYNSRQFNLRHPEDRYMVDSLLAAREAQRKAFEQESKSEEGPETVEVTPNEPTNRTDET